MPEDPKEIFLKKRFVYLTGEVNEDMAKNTIKEILTLETDDPIKDIVVIISSFGGNIVDMYSIIDTINLVSCKVHTLCIGKAMSAGAMILLSGSIGNRYCTEHSSIMLHSISGGTCGKTTDIKTYSKEMERIEQELRDHILKRTKIPKKLLEEKFINDWYLTSKESLALGIVDKIIHDFSEIKLNRKLK